MNEYARRPRITKTNHPAVANCTHCDQPLTGTTLIVQGHLKGQRPPRWLAQFLCEPCAQELGYLRHDGAMTDEDVTALFDRLANRDYNTHDLNRWGVSYLKERDGYRRHHPRDRATILAADRYLVEALGEDPELLFDFCTSSDGYYFARATMFGEGFGQLGSSFAERYGRDPRAAFIACFREGYNR